MDKLKDKRVLVLIGVVVVIIIALVIFFIFIKDKGELDASKLNSSEVVKKQEEVTNLVRGYVDNISNIKEYARNNSKVEFSIKELRGLLSMIMIMKIILLYLIVKISI